MRYITSLACQGALKDHTYLTTIAFVFQGYHGIEEDVFLSLPCVIGSHGIKCVIKQSLDENEVNKLRNCARIMHDIQHTLVL